MKITKLYSNFPEEFAPILFNAGLHSTSVDSDLLNVILAEFTDPDNFNKTSHNLGKSTLVQILDFVLLKEINN